MLDNSLTKGATVSITMMDGTDYEGMFICSDPVSQALILSGKDLRTKKPVTRVINLKFVKNLTPVSDATAKSEDAVTNLQAHWATNAKKAQERMNMQVKMRSDEMMPADNVSLAGQKAFLQIKKTIADTHWEGPNIRVLGLALVKSPYEPQNVEMLKATTHSQSDDDKARNAMSQLRRILSKPYNADERIRPDHIISK